MSGAKREGRMMTERLLPYDPVPWLMRRDGLSAVVPRGPVRDGLGAPATRQKRNGTLGASCRVQGVAVALAAMQTLAGPAGQQAR